MESSCEVMRAGVACFWEHMPLFTIGIDQKSIYCYPRPLFRFSNPLLCTTPFRQDLLAFWIDLPVLEQSRYASPWHVSLGSVYAISGWGMSVGSAWLTCRITSLFSTLGHVQPERASTLWYVTGFYVNNYSYVNKGKWKKGGKMGLWRSSLFDQ